MQAYRQFEAHKDTIISSICLIENSDFVLTAGWNDKTIKLHSLLDEGPNSTQVLSHLQTTGYNRLSATKDLCMATTLKNIMIFDLTKDEAILNIPNTVRGSTLQGVLPEPMAINDAKILNENMVVTSTPDHFINFFDVRMDNSNSGNRGLFSFALGDHSLNEIGYYDYYLTCGSDNGKIYALDLRNSQAIGDQISNHRVIRVNQYNNDLSLLLDSYGQVRLYNVATCTPLLTFKANEANQPLKYPLGIQYIPERNCIINSGSNGHILVRKLSANLTRPMPEISLLVAKQNSKQGAVLDNVIYDADADRMVATSLTGIVHVWNNVFDQPK